MAEGKSAPGVFTNFGRGEPNNVNGEHCLHGRPDAMWNDVPCAHGKFVVIEYNTRNLLRSTGGLFELLPGSMTFEDAQRAAASSMFGDVAGHLASPSSVAESQFLQTMYGDESEAYWLGAQQTGGEWVWADGVTGGITFYADGNATAGQEANWAPGEPAPGLACAVSGGVELASWAARECTAKASILVEYDVRSLISFGGSVYEILDEAMIFVDASSAATSRSHEGVVGHLVTIESTEENDALNKAFGSSYWIGATDIEKEGQWKWTSGPRADQVFWNGDALGSAVDGMYSNWNDREPNNAGGTQPPLLGG